MSFTLDFMLSTILPRLVASRLADSACGIFQINYGIDDNEDEDDDANDDANKKQLIINQDEMLLMKIDDGCAFE